MTVLRVNPAAKTIRREELPGDLRPAGGRLLAALLLQREAPADCEPLGPENKLIFAPGLLAASKLPASARISVGSKSPLTNGIKESNGGGTAALRMSELGLRALIIEGGDPLEPLLLEIGPTNAQLVSAKQLSGKGCYETARLLRERYGNQAAFSLVGPAGERRYPAALIAHSDMEGRPSRVSGRGGLGAVMAAKGLKAIVYMAGGNFRQEQPTGFAEKRKEFTRVLKAHPATQIYSRYGTAAMVNTTVKMGILPTYNFSGKPLENALLLSGENMVKNIELRGGAGKATHACMPGCVIRCSNVYPDLSGEEMVAPLEFETIGLMGSNCGFTDLDFIARLNYLANDIGVDTIETGGALGVLMDSGEIPFGDREAAMRCMEEIVQDTLLGRILASGTQLTGRLFNVRRVPVVKGQCFAAFDPRGVKGLGVTYATSPQGADHTAGHTIRAQIDHLSPEGQAALSRGAQIRSALYDTLGLCMFVMPAMGLTPLFVETVSAYLHLPPDESELTNLGLETLQVERQFNLEAGIGPARDDLPLVFRKESLPATGSVFDVPVEELRTLF